MAKDILPEHMTAQRDGYQRHFAISIFTALFFGLGFALYAPFTEWVVSYAIKGPYRLTAFIDVILTTLSLIYLPFVFDPRYAAMKLRSFKGFSSLPKIAGQILNKGVKNPITAAIAACFIVIGVALIAIEPIRANLIYMFNAWLSYTGTLLTDPAEVHRTYIADSTPKVEKGDALSALFATITFIAPIIKYLIWLIAGGLVGAVIQLGNPYKNLIMKDGFVEWCDDAWLENNMERKWDKHFGWMDGQIGINGGKLMALGRWTGRRRKGQMVKMIETLSMMCLAPPGTGKSLAPHEQLIRYDGTIARADEVRAGDLLMGPNSKPRLVTNITPGFGPMHRITPETGKPWECNGPHILSLRCPEVSDEPKFVSVEDYIQWPQEEKDVWKSWRPSHIDFPDPATPIVDPYLVGLALAGESPHEKSIEHATYFQFKANLLNLRFNIALQDKSPDLPEYCSFPDDENTDRKLEQTFSEAIGHYALNVLPSAKFIPFELKVASRQHRLRLLAAIIDVQGHYDPDSEGFGLISRSATFAADLAFIGRSLGFSVDTEIADIPFLSGALDFTIPPEFENESPPSAQESENPSETWFISIRGKVNTIPCLIKSKKAPITDNQEDISLYDFTIEPIADGPYVGMMLNEDHQYLLQDFTVTHNTAGLIVPTIIQDDHISFIVNDPKPELYEMTGAHRERVSALFMLNWSKVDTINSTNPDKSVFYPRFNFLSSQLVPPPGPNRDTYLDSIAKVLIPDQKGGGDSYFTDKGRAALTGFLHFLITHGGDYQNHYFSLKKKRLQDHRAKINLPPEWLENDSEPSLPMLSDWMAYAQIASSGGAPREEKDFNEMTDEEQDQILNDAEKPVKAQDPNADLMKVWLLDLVKLEMATNGSSRAMVELSSLVNMADKERSGVLGTMDKALLPFKNSAVKERAGACDFTPDDFRGVFKDAIRKQIVDENISTKVWTKDTEEGENILVERVNAIIEKERLKHNEWTTFDEDHERLIAEKSFTSNHSTPTGFTTVIWDDPRYRDICISKTSWIPVTLYMSINQADAPAFASITSLLYEVLATALISLEPGGYNEKSQHVVGPFEVCFALDEFAKLPKTPKLLEGPDLARSKKVSFMIICQSMGQILQIYSKEEAQTIKATTAIKHVFPQNDSESIKEVQGTVSTTTVKTMSRSTQEGLQKNANPFAWSESDKVEKADFLRSEDISSIKSGHHLVLVQGHLNHPMLLETPLFFKDPEIKKKVRSRGEGDIAKTVVPLYIKTKRQLERDKNYKEQIEKAVAEKINDARKDPPQQHILEFLMHGHGIKNAA